MFLFWFAELAEQLQVCTKNINQLTRRCKKAISNSLIQIRGNTPFYESNRYVIQNQRLEGTFYFCLRYTGQVFSGISIINLCRTLLWYPMAAFLIEHEKNAVFLLPMQVFKLVNSIINIVTYFSVGNCWTSKFVSLEFRSFILCSTLV